MPAFARLLAPRCLFSATGFEWRIFIFEVFEMLNVHHLEALAYLSSFILSLWQYYTEKLCFVSL
jgi:hypothetical protein